MTIADQPTGSTERSGLVARHPATSVIQEFFRSQDLAPQRSSLERFFGVDPVSRIARSWYTGAIGEREIARLLNRLGPDHLVLHSVPVGAGESDIDHVVLGPRGVFTINTKHHADKQLWVGDRVLLVSGHKTDHLRNSRHEAERASQRLSAAAGIPVPVTPIICVYGAKAITDKRSSRNRDVVVCTSNRLIREISKGRPVLDVAVVERLRSVVNAPSTWHDTAAGLPDQDAIARFDAFIRDVTSATYRRLLWLGGLATGAVVAGFSALTGLLG